MTSRRQPAPPRCQGACPDAAAVGGAANGFGRGVENTSIAGSAPCLPGGRARAFPPSTARELENEPGRKRTCYKVNLNLAKEPRWARCNMRMCLISAGIAAQTMPNANPNTLLRFQQQLVSGDISMFSACQQQLLIKQILHCISGETL